MSKLIVVLGMHRSGTSVITRALKAMGVDLGENLLPAMSHVNEKGFWEDQEILDINVGLLGMTGFDWYDNAPGIRQVDMNDVHSGLRRRALNVLQSRLDQYEIFAMKDPRMAIMLPFWKEVFVDAGCDCKFLIALRNPKSIVDSLVKRDGFSPIKIYYLWLEYMLPSILETRGYSRLVVDYDLFMDNPESQMRRIATELDLNVDFTHDLSVTEFLNGFLETDLRHSRYSFESLATDDSVPPEVLDVFTRFLFMSDDRIRPDDPETYNLFGKIDARMRNLIPLLGCINKLEREIRRYRLEADGIGKPCVEESRDTLSKGIQKDDAVLSPQSADEDHLETANHVLIEPAENARFSAFERMRKYLRGW